MIANIPNILTCFRLIAAAAIPVIYALFPHPLSDLIVLILFIGASLTDWLDGYLARRWNQISPIGRLLDPIADKAMVGVALLVICGLYGGHWLVLIPAGLILLREFAVAGLREFLAGRPVDLGVSRLAKWKTTVQMVAIAMLLFSIYADFAGIITECVVCGRPALSEVDIAGLALLWLAAAMTVISGWQYFAKGLVVILKEEPT